MKDTWHDRIQHSADVDPANFMTNFKGSVD